MDERDLWWICGAIACLAIGSLLKTRILAHHDEMIREHDDDIQFLKQALKAMDERVD